MKYIFEIVQTVIVDSDELKVGNEEEARELLDIGFKQVLDTKTQLVRVGH